LPERTTQSGCSESDTPLPQPLGQELSGLRQPAGNRPFRNAKPDCGILATPTIEFAQHDNCPEVVRQGRDFRIEDAKGVGIRFVPDRGWVIRKRGCWNLPGTAACRHNSSLLSGTGSNPIHPPPNRLSGVDDRGTLGKDKESGLESILGQVHIRRHTPADTQNHRAKSTDQLGKRSLVSRPYKTGEQLTIRCFGFGGLERPPKLSDSSGE
jgi:hypothetical protein